MTVLGVDGATVVPVGRTAISAETLVATNEKTATIRRKRGSFLVVAIVLLSKQTEVLWATREVNGSVAFVPVFFVAYRYSFTGLQLNFG